MRTYESVFILDERKFEDNGEAFAKELVSNIEGLGGAVKECNNLGRRQFARPVRKQNAGLYWHLVFDLDPANIIQLKEKYRLNDAIFRSEVLIKEA